MVIAAVVIGGVALTGGEGYVLGAFFGVLILSLIQSLILYHGELSSWWTSIFIGMLMLLFIGVQSVLATLNTRGLARAASGGAGGTRRPLWRDRRLLAGAAVIIAAVIGMQLVGWLGTSPDAATDGDGTAATAGCEAIETREEEAAALQADGAAIVIEKFGGSRCVDLLFGLYPDGRIVGDDGTDQLETQVEPEVVADLVANLEGLGWFTDEMYTTWHHPCGECYTYSITVTSGDESKTVGAVDGGTDAPAKYWLATSRISALLPESNGAE